MSPAEWTNYKKLWRNGPGGLEDEWTEYTEFAARHHGSSTSSTGVVWAGENHGCPCRFHTKTKARDAVGVGRHPERPDRLHKIMESWQKNTYSHSPRAILVTRAFLWTPALTLDYCATFDDFQVEKLQRQSYLSRIQANIFVTTTPLHLGTQHTPNQSFAYPRHHPPQQVPSQLLPSPNQRGQHPRRPSQRRRAGPIPRTINKSRSQIHRKRLNLNRIFRRLMSLL